MPGTLDRDHFLHDYEPGSTERTLPRASLTNREPIQQQHLLLSKEHRKGTSITNIRVTSITTGALASAVLGLAGNANAAPSRSLSVDTAVSQLRAQGFEVIVNRIGTAPSDQCTVGAVRPSQTFSRTDSGVPGAGDDLVTTVTNKTLYVDVSC